MANMIYLDNGATSFRKPLSVIRAVERAMLTGANPGRGDYACAMQAAEMVLQCRERAAKLFDCLPEQVVFTSNCTHGLNIAIRTLIRPGDRVVISGFEHNAVMRPLYDMGVKTVVAGRKLFNPADTVDCFEKALRQGADAAIFTHVSNVFGYILPVAELSELCRRHGVPFVIDAAQSAGILPISLEKTGASFIAMPGHKGLLGPQGTGILLCGAMPDPILFGGTGSMSKSPEMPDFLPDRAEAGTLNVPGIAGLEAGLDYLERTGIDRILEKERQQMRCCAEYLNRCGWRVFTGKDQCGTVSFVPDMDCEVFASRMAKQGIALRAGLHCAPLAHESAGTLDTGTVRISFGHDASRNQTRQLLKTLSQKQIFCE